MFQPQEIVGAHRFLDIDTGPAALALDELVTDGILHPEGRILRVSDLRVADIAVHGKSVIGSQVARPVKTTNGRVQFIG